MAILNELDENQLANIALMLQAAKQAINEAEDDAYCAQLYKQYENDPDRGQYVTLDAAAKELGVTL